VVWHRVLTGARGKPIGRDFRNATGRRFIPSLALLWADIGEDVVGSYRSTVGVNAIGGRRYIVRNK
jgi:hypothetical protein